MVPSVLDDEPILPMDLSDPPDNPRRLDADPAPPVCDSTLPPSLSAAWKRDTAMSVLEMRVCAAGDADTRSMVARDRFVSVHVGMMEPSRS
eukprot:3086613-Rhodomonas_salina.2